jgi:hypothetical protein
MTDETPAAAEKPAAKKPGPKKPATGKTPADPTTKPVPVVAPAAVETEPAEVPAKKRRRWPWVVGGIVLFLVVALVIAYVIGENYAKNYARDYIKERIVAVLGVEDPGTVTVDVAGPVLLQALAGKLNQVDVTAESVTFGTLSGAATVHAEGVPLDANAPTDALDVTFAVPEDQVVAAVGQNLSSLPIDSISLDEPEVVVTATFSFLIIEIPFGMGLEPSAEDGQIVFTPTRIQLFDEDYSQDEASEFLGEFATQLFAEQKICVNESLPVALKIVDVDVVKKDLVITINGDGVVMGGSDLSTPGTCAG